MLLLVRQTCRSAFIATTTRVDFVVLLILLGLLMLCALPWGTWLQTPARDRDLLAEASWSTEVVTNGSRVLQMLSTPVFLGPATSVRLRATLSVATPDVASTYPGEFLTLDIYAGAGYDKSAHDINLSYQDLTRTPQIERLLDVHDAPATVVLRVFHFMPVAVRVQDIALHTVPSVLQRCVRMHMRYRSIILFVSTVSMLFWIWFRFARRRVRACRQRAVAFVSAGILVSTGLAARVFPLPVAHGKDVAAEAWSTFTRGTGSFTLKQNPGEGLPVCLAASRWYVAVWDHRLCGSAPGGAAAWFFDLFP
jgi:hypothetical protein